MEFLKIGIGFALGLVTMYQILKHDLIYNQPILNASDEDTSGDDPKDVS